MCRFYVLLQVKKLYVGNLPYSTADADLQSMFAQYGAVDKASVLMDRLSGRSRGFGFVEMTNDEEALAAIEGLNGKEIDGRKLVVNEARPKEDRPRRSFGGGGSSGGSRGGFGGGSRGGYGGGYNRGGGDSY